ncbi:MAG: cupin domain-containing protein [Rhodospirillales bacterium]|nr:cupin domain-containing protein [Rhodospirillales bacterium]
MGRDLNIHADFSRRVVVDSSSMDWESSPSPTVWRKRLSLSGGAESGIVTSIVRYDADSAFSEHPHPGGEEIFVLDGVFSDEHGDYPAGSFLLNPEGFRHAPRSKDGCVIFVKLRQYEDVRRERRVIDSNAMDWLRGPNPGTWFKPLYTQPGFPERVRLVRMDPGAGPIPHDHPGGEEILLLDGAVEDENGRYATGTWIRDGAGSRHAPFTRTGCTMLVRQGFLPVA